ncbi:hypothetical protein HMSSN036_38440 [Paenibacillus macerans]|nr:hypothetical protein HMSSN036_38440 [Paenibacillus macerans]
MRPVPIIKRAVQWGWMGWERVFEAFSRLRSKYAGEYGICKMFVTKYRGKGMLCEDGTWIHDGDWIGELHLDNRKILALLQSHEANRVALMIARLMRGTMRQICAEMVKNPQLSQVKRCRASLCCIAASRTGWALRRIKWKAAPSAR